MEEQYCEASCFKRFFAILIDTILCIVIFKVLSNFFLKDQSIFIIFYCIFQVLVIFYNIVMLKFFNATIGKMILNIEVISINNKKLSWKSSFFRQFLNLIITIPNTILLILIILKMNNWTGINTVYIALNLLKTSGFGDIISILVFIIGTADIITMLVNENKRSLHDFIAGTIVIDKKDGQ